VDIAALLLWFVTAGAGLYLLMAGRPSSTAARAGQEPAEDPARATVPPSPPPQLGLPQSTVDALAAGATVPPITHTRVKPPPGQHPLLEFIHPALGIIGLGCWIAYVATQFTTFAWVAFGVLVATISAGVTWFTVNARAAAARAASSGAGPGPSAGPGSGSTVGSGGRHATEGRNPVTRRLLIHGTAALTTFVLALITLLLAIRG
jgi:hypothetical protein